MRKVYRSLFNVCIWIIVGLLAGCQCNCNTPIFSFDVTADMRKFTNTEYLTPGYFKGACLAILKTGKGAFMVSPGDIDPSGGVYNMINNVFGSDYPWYPVSVNHEVETSEDMEWLRKYERGMLLDHA